MKYLLFILIFILALSCDESNTKKQELTQGEIHTISQLKSFDELFNIKYLKLKTDNIILPNLSRTPISDIKGNIYLLCQGQEIYKFDKFGNFVNVLKRIGRGPGEYIKISCFYVDPFENIYIDNDRDQRIMIFDSTLNLKGEIYKKTSLPFNQLFEYNDLLVGYSPLDRNNPLYIFDIKNLSLDENIGIPNEEIKKLGVYLFGGQCDFTDDNLYYMFPEQYQIFNVFNGVTTKLLDTVPNYFVSPEKKLNSPREIKGRKFSESVFLFAEGNLLFLGMKQNFLGGNKDFIFDIYSTSGKLIRSKLPFNIDKPIIKYGTRKYISYEIVPRNDGENNFDIRIILLEYRI